MVKRVFRFFAYFLFFIFALILFAPKANLYYFAEEQLQKQGVVISNEHAIEHLFSLELQNMHISFEGIDSAVVKQGNIVLLGVYNKIVLHDITLAKMLHNFLPIHIQNITLKYTILDPLVIHGAAEGDFGTLKAKVSITQRHLQAVLKPSKQMKQKYKNSLREFKKDKTGAYSYEQTF